VLTGAALVGDELVEELRREARVDVFVLEIWKKSSVSWERERERIIIILLLSARCAVYI
jgi:hypothetical protein